MKDDRQEKADRFVSRSTNKRGEYTQWFRFKRWCKINARKFFIIFGFVASFVFSLYILGFVFGLSTNASILGMLIVGGIFFLVTLGYLQNERGSGNRHHHYHYHPSRRSWTKMHGEGTEFPTAYEKERKGKNKSRPSLDNLSDEEIEKRMRRKKE